MLVVKIKRAVPNKSVSAMIERKASRAPHTPNIRHSKKKLKNKKISNDVVTNC